MTDLGPEASEHSLSLYRLAQELVLSCPPELGREVGLTGSVSRGLADRYSDLELNFWVDVLPPTSTCVAWLRRQGASETVVERRPERDGSIWIVCRWQGVWLEADWRAIVSLKERLQAILAAEVVEHETLALAEAVYHALPLRTSGLIHEWQKELSAYPFALQERLVSEATTEWRSPQRIAETWALAQRGDVLPLVGQLVRDVQNVLRVLFAINRQWEPEWKWVPVMVSRLAVKPERLAERIAEVLSTPRLEDRVAADLRLVLDTLSLVPPPHDVAQAIAVVRDALSPTQ